MRIAWRAEFLGFLGFVGLIGCAGPTHPPGVEAAAPPAEQRPATPPADEPAQDEAPAAEPATPDEQRLTGVLKYTELQKRKSVDAYLGKEFTLLVGSESHNLRATGAVPEARLRALDGATITVRVRFHPAAQPDPREQAPLGPDGTEMERPAYYEVLEIAAAP